MFGQLQRGRDETIIEPELPIIDAQHHLFLRPGLRYLLEEYLADASAGHNVLASVYVEADSFRRREGPEVMRPLGEIEFANGAAAMAASGAFGDQRVAAAIVGFADLLHGDAVAAYLDQALQLAPDRMRGIRQGATYDTNEATYRYLPGRPPRGMLADPRFRAGFGHLAPRGLSFDAAVFHHQLPELADLADAFPETAIIVGHCGLALGMNTDADGRATVFAQWRENMRELALRSNVTCKISGLGLPFWGFGFEDRAGTVGYRELAAAWAPYVEAAIEIFGADRCMMASDYPADSHSSGFVPLWNALKHIVCTATSEEKNALFHDTAARIYRIDRPAE
ncbi:amidohydrolase family protein [Streptomyces sp. NPDC090088]|uniref:amidohydrolase family protein n=1 Tax=Streptomyces sp. NPDC090088 TaxID=3365944 RepID=UPI003820F4CB